MKSKILLIFLLLFSTQHIVYAQQAGNALSLIGNSYMRVLHHEDFNIPVYNASVPNAGDRTISFWVKGNNFSANARIIAKRKAFGSGFEFITGNANGWSVNARTLTNNNVGSTQHVEAPNTISNTEWNHLALVLQRQESGGDGKIKLFFNGTLVQTVPNALAVGGAIENTADLLIGAGLNNNNSPNNYFKGMIDEVRFYNKALTSAQLTADMSSVPSELVTNLYARWTFENAVQDAGVTKVADVVGGKIGTLNGGAAIVDKYTFGVETTVLPVGKGSKNQRLIAFKLVNHTGTQVLNSLTFNLKGTNYMKDVAALKLYVNRTGNFDLERFPTESTLLQDNIAIPSNAMDNIVLPINYNINQEGAYYFYLVCDVAPNAVEGFNIGASLVAASVNNEALSESSSFALRNIVLENILLWSPGDLGARSYRIPAITKTKDGALLAVIDRRNNGTGDITPTNNIDIALRRSTDNGKTWSNSVNVYGDDTNVSMSDPSLLTTATGEIIMMANMGASFFSSQPYNPATPDNTLRPVFSKSTDNGQTWTAPVDLASIIYPEIPNVTAAFITSGNLLQLKRGTHAGRIMGVLCCRYTTGGANGNHIIYSDDNGANWAVVAANAVNGSAGDEAKVVELNDGTVVLSSRRNGSRLFVRSTDGGLTWGTPYAQTDIKDPACNGDFIRYTSTLDQHDADRILHSIPYANSRRNVSLLLSHDEASTFPIRRSIYTGASAYSALTVLNDGTIGVLWECGEKATYDIYFTRVSLDWLTNNSDFYKTKETAETQTKGPITNDHTLLLKGNKGYLKVDDNNILDIAAGESKTLTFWVKLAANAQNNAVLLSKKTPTNNGYELALNATDHLVPNISSIQNAMTSIVKLKKDQWHHVALAMKNFDGLQSIKTYIDGWLVAENMATEATAQDLSNAAPLLFGANTTAANQVANFLKGELDDIRVFDRALLASEVWQDKMTDYTASTAMMPSLVSIWDFENTTVKADSTISVQNGKEATLPALVLGATIAYHPDVTLKMGLINSNEENYLEWTILTGADKVDYFDIEESINNEPFKAIEKIYAQADATKYKHLLIQGDVAKRIRLRIVTKQGKIIYTDVLLLKEKENQTIAVYPNPVALQLHTRGLEGQYFIVSVAGNVVKSGILKKNEAIQVATLASGMYYLRIGNEMIKFIKR